MSKNGTDNLHTETIGIKGMSCQSCVKKVTTRLTSLKGVEHVDVSLLNDTALVKFNSQTISLDKIKSEIDALGYSTGAHKRAKRQLNRGAIVQGIVYALTPHIGCMAFIVGSIFAVTFLTEAFTPLLMNPYFFYYLLVLALAFATISSTYYLVKEGLLSMRGMKKKWKYLSTMYGSVVGVNLVLFMVVFPLLANLTMAPVAASPGAQLCTVRLAVEIPCPGHAPLITGELKKIDGVLGTQFSLPNTFDVNYECAKASLDKMLALDVFKEYKATVLVQPHITEVTSVSGTTGSTSTTIGVTTSSTWTRTSSVIEVNTITENNTTITTTNTTEIVNIGCGC